MEKCSSDRESNSGMKKFVDGGEFVDLGVMHPVARIIKVC
jgi:hypothetical protein